MSADQPSGCHPAPGTSSGELDEMWRRQLVWWHVFFGVLVATTAGVLVAEQPDHVGWSLLGVGVVAVAYLVWGRRGIGGEERAVGVRYVAVAWVALVAVMAVDGSGSAWILTFGLFPQTWGMLRRNHAAAVVVAAVLAIGAVRLWQAPRTGDDVIGIAISTVITLSLSLVMGLFIHKIIHEADSRASTIDELRRTQAQLAAAERAQGVASERERMSREIHDTLAQGFTSVVTLARATEAALDRGDLDVVRERVRLIEQTAADNLSEARLIVAEMTPGHLQSRTLSEALCRLVDAVAAESAMQGRLVVRGEPTVLPANSEVVLLRTAQEGLANVRRHAQASTFEVRLTYAADAPVSLEVADDGVGFVPDTPDRGYGLDGATARADEVGGSFEVHTAPGAGTRLRMEVPR